MAKHAGATFFLYLLLNPHSFFYVFSLTVQTLLPIATCHHVYLFSEVRRTRVSNANTLIQTFKKSHPNGNYNIPLQAIFKITIEMIHKLMKFILTSNNKSYKYEIKWKKKTNKTDKTNILHFILLLLPYGNINIGCSTHFLLWFSMYICTPLFHFHEECKRKWQYIYF